MGKQNNTVKFVVLGFFGCSGVPAARVPAARIPECSGVPGCYGVFRCSGVPVFRSVPVFLVLVHADEKL